MPRIKAGSISINYETYGEGEPLLLIMGFGMPGAAWLPSLPMLTGFKCIYFDNRGTGDTDKPDGAYTIPDMAEDASNLFAALGIAKAKVFGVSMGGMIAQELTLRHPGQVTKLVLGCTTAGGPTAKMAAPEVGAQLVGAFALMQTDIDKALDQILPVLYPPAFIAAHPEVKEFMKVAMKQVPPTPPASIAATAVGVQQFNAYERLDQIKCPVLIVHGELDVLVPPENAHIIKSRIPHAELFMIANAGHGFQAADPMGINARIVEWLKS